MRITRMSEDEFELWSGPSRAAYAADKMRANGLTKAEAEKIADDDFRRLLPLGLHSKDNHLFTATDSAAKGEAGIVGFVWFCVRGSEDNRRAFICDILVKEPFRGRGFGKKMMLHVEQEAKAMGLSRIGLHVFGFNENALRLYQSLGYQTTDLVLEKSLRD